MAKIVQRPTITLEVLFTVTEAEFRALDALAGYGDDAFIKVFYEKLGKSYMEPNETGLRLFLQTIRDMSPGIIGRLDDARKVFTGEKRAIGNSAPNAPAPASKAIRTPGNAQEHGGMSGLTEKQIQAVADAIARTDMDEHEFSDNVAIIMVSEFERDPQCPAEETDDELGWKPWALEKEKNLRRRMAIAAIEAYEKARP